MLSDTTPERETSGYPECPKAPVQKLWKPSLPISDFSLDHFDLELPRDDSFDLEKIGKDELMVNRILPTHKTGLAWLNDQKLEVKSCKNRGLGIFEMLRHLSDKEKFPQMPILSHLSKPAKAHSKLLS